MDTMTIHLEEFMVNEPMMSLRIWRIQSAPLMSLPYVVRNITMPALPLQITLTPLSLALILVAIFHVIGWDSKSEGKSRHVFRTKMIFCTVWIDSPSRLPRSYNPR